MGPKIRLSLLFLFLILFQVIIASEEENIEKSSDLHREKRAFGRSPSRGSNSAVSYIVSLRQRNVPHCAGTVLTTNIVLTAAHCVYHTGPTLSVLAGSYHRNFGSYHSVKNLQMYPGFNPNNFVNDLALLYVVPPIPSQGIPLYNGAIQPGAHGIFRGWGCTTFMRNRTTSPDLLSSMEVPILNNSGCPASYGPQYLCTGDNWGPAESCFNLSGGPLTVDGKLVSIMSLHTRRSPNHPHPPEFINLNYGPYKQWITSTVRHLQIIRG